MAAISIQLRADQVTPGLQALQDPELMRRISLAAGTLMSSFAQRAFDEAGLRPAPWPARKDNKSHPLLRLSHDLRQGIHVQQSGSDSVRIGSPAKYAATHQLGRGGIPARPFFPVRNDQLTGEVTDAMAEAARILIEQATQ